MKKQAILLLMLCVSAPMLCAGVPMLAQPQGSIGPALIEDNYPGTWQGVVCGAGVVSPFDATDNKNLAVDGKMPLFLKVKIENHESPTDATSRSAVMTVVHQEMLNPFNPKVTTSSAKFPGTLNGPYQANNAHFDQNGRMIPRDAWTAFEFSTNVASGQVGTVVLFSKRVPDGDTGNSVKDLEGGVLITAVVGAGSMTKIMDTLFLPAEGSAPAGYTALSWEKFVQKYMSYCDGHPAKVEEKK